MNNHELIEEYLKGNLKGDSLKAFESQMATDSAFASEVADHKSVGEFIFMQGLIETKLKLQHIRKDRLESEKTRWKKIKIWGGGVLAGALLISSVIYFSSNDQKKEDTSLAQNAINSSSGISVDGSGIQDSGSKDKNIPLQNNNTEGQSVENGNNNTINIDSEEKNNDSGKQESTSVKDESKKDKDKAEETISRDRDVPKGVEDVTDTVAVVHPIPAPCSLVTFVPEIKTEKSCIDKNTGSIILMNGSGAGYYLSVNNQNFISGNSLQNLSSGIYDVTVKDASGCLFTVNDVVIESKVCPVDKKIFMPETGQIWKYPVNEKTTCKVRIFNSKGVMVFETNVANGIPEGWDGSDMNGMALEGGGYIYSISCEDGSGDQGSVTIAR